MPQKLTVKWSRKESDLVAHFPMSTDGRFILDVLSKQVVESLRNRGYDVESLRFSVTRRPERDLWIVRSGKQYLTPEGDWADDPMKALKFDDQMQAYKKCGDYPGTVEANLFYALEAARK